MHITHGLMHKRSLDFELGRLNRKSCNDIIRSFWKVGLFMGWRMKDQKLGVWFGLKPGFAIWEGLKLQVKIFSILSKLVNVVSKLVQLKHVTEKARGRSPQSLGDFLEKNGYFNAILITIRTFSEPFKRSKFLMFESRLKKTLSLLQVKSKTCLKSCILGLNFVTWPKSGESRYIAFCNIFSIK